MTDPDDLDHVDPRARAAIELLCISKSPLRRARGARSAAPPKGLALPESPRALRSQLTYRAPSPFSNPPYRMLDFQTALSCAEESGSALFERTAHVPPAARTLRSVADQRPSTIQGFSTYAASLGTCMLHSAHLLARYTPGPTVGSSPIAPLTRSCPRLSMH